MKDKKNLILIAVIMAVAATAMFLVVDISAVFLIGYGFALSGIAGLLITASQMTDKKDSYPWSAAVPMQALTYLIIEVVFSAVVVALKELDVFTINAAVFAALHILILAFFAVRIVMMKGGADHIESSGEKAEAKIRIMNELRSEMCMLVQEAENESIKSNLKKLEEAVRYSDPVTSEQMVDEDFALLERTKRLHSILNDEEKAVSEIDAIGEMLKLRNIKTKMSK